MGCLNVKAAECKYYERNRQFKDQFISKLNDEIMITEIIRVFTAINDANTVTSSQ